MMDEAYVILLTIYAIFALGFSFTPTPDLKPHVEAHQAWRAGR
jgi:hypothetical protein